MRCFVALIPPAAALAELEAAIAPLRERYPDLRWTPTAQWHLTLAFLEIDEGVLPELGERLSRAAHRHPPLSPALAGGGRFGDRVLWTRVLVTPDGSRPDPSESSVLTGRVSRSGRRGDGLDALRRLSAAARAAARRCGLAVEKRPYRPHLTLARGREGVDLRPAVDVLAGFRGTPWTAHAMHLVRSRLGAGPGGTARHEVIATWPLGGPRPT